MKTKLLTLSFCLLSAGMFAEQYFPEGSQWERSNLEFMITCLGCESTAPNMSEIALIGDTTINNLDYQVFHQVDGMRADWVEEVFFIRREGNKLYGWTKNEDYDEEYLLADYDMLVGDSMIIPKYDGRGTQKTDTTTVHVVAIDSIRLNDGRLAKRLLFDKNKKPIIEYIGSEDLSDLFAYRYNTDDYYTEGSVTVCYKINDDLLYSCIKKTDVFEEYMPYLKPLFCESAYFPKDMKWNILVEDMCLDEAPQIKTLSVGNDTVIDGHLYQMINNIPIRHLNNRIYCRVQDQEDNFVDYMMYDFNLEVGDSIEKTFYHQDLTNKYAYVVKVDTISLMDGRKAKRVQYDSRETDVEYIGNIGRGLFAPLDNIIPPCGVKEYLSCCYSDEDMIYDVGNGGCSDVEVLSNADTWYGVEIDYMTKKYYGVKYYLSDSFVWHSLEYRSLWRDGGYTEGVKRYGALRPTDNGKKIYLLDMTGQYEDFYREYLLYDFAAEVGDTVDAYFKLEDMHIYTDHMGEAKSVGWIVRDKQVIDGRIHTIVERCYKGGEQGPAYTTEWIQGIGTKHVLWPYMYGYAEPTTLYSLCATRGDKQLYSFDVEYLGIENNCTEWHLINDALENNYSNGNMINVENNVLTINDNNIIYATIYDLQGRELLRSDLPNIDMSPLSSGLYLVTVQTDKGLWSEKFVVK